MPVASSSASNVRMFSENPTSQMVATVPMRATGIVTAGMTVAPAVRRKRNITATTMAVEINSDLTTSWIAAPMKTASSEVTRRSTSSGNTG